MNKGWISINRKIQSHWLWEEKREFSKLEAWLDILLTVNHSEQKVMIKNTLFTVKRGDSIKSLETWGSRWNWNKSKVRRFLKLLENDSMIVTKNESKTTRLTVCKYDSYQSIGNDNETIVKQKRNADETQVTPNNNDNNNNNENNDLYTEKNFLENWAICRKVILNKPTHISKLDNWEKPKFNKAVVEFGKEKINTALNGLFKQEVLNIGSMTLKPNHFLENVDKYYQAEMSKEYTLYGAKKKIIQH